jgi:pimeloyl-ACP methyl ester carboxylesterase
MNKSISGRPLHNAGLRACPISHCHSSTSSKRDHHSSKAMTMSVATITTNIIHCKLGHHVASHVKRCLSTSSSASPVWHGEWRNETADTPIVYLHGLLGNNRNLQTFANQVCRQTSRSGYLVDVRGHGKSKNVQYSAESQSQSTANITTSIMSKCAYELYNTLQQAGVIANDSSAYSIGGHSLGGRIALEYAAKSALTLPDASTIIQPPPSSIWLLDTVPGMANKSVENVLNIAGDIELQSRPFKKAELITYLTTDRQLDKPTAQWLASSYNSQQHMFSFDLQMAHEFVQALQQQDFMGLLEQILEQGDTQVNIVKAGKNTGWQETNSWPVLEDMESQYSQLGLHVLPKAGHWVHIDDLPGLLEIMKRV